jgi:hypothetical protein
MSQLPPVNDKVAMKRRRAFEALAVWLGWYNVIHLAFVCAVLLRVIAEHLGFATPEVTPSTLTMIGAHAVLLLAAYVWVTRRVASKRSARS